MMACTVDELTGPDFDPRNLAGHGNHELDEVVVHGCQYGGEYPNCNSAPDESSEPSGGSDGPSGTEGDTSPPPPEEPPPGCSAYNAYAPPWTWGSWYFIQDHIGEITFQVTASAVGDTQLFGEVRYATGGGWAQDPFGASHTFRTGNAVATVTVRFYGSPYGTAVNGRICAIG